jgi:uncharacterized lipoprotein
VSLILLTAAAIAGCSRGSTLLCSGDTGYLAAQSAGQLRIPDNLSVPDETESLRIPAGVIPRTAVDPNPESCLEESPAFLDNE